MLENLKFEYRGDMTERRMVFSMADDEGDFREKMLMVNRICGYLPLSISHEGNEKLYQYDISGMRSLADVLSEREVNEDFLRFLLGELERIFIRGRSYMLEEDNYILHPDALYLNGDGSLMVCYLPDYEKDVKLQLSSLLTYLMDAVDVSDRRSVYAFYTTLVLAREENSTFRTLINALDKRDEHEEEKEEETGESRDGENDPQKEERKRERGNILLSKGIRRAIVYTALILCFAGVIIFFLFF